MSSVLVKKPTNLHLDNVMGQVMQCCTLPLLLDPSISFLCSYITSCFLSRCQDSRLMLSDVFGSATLACFLRTVNTDH